MNKLIIYIIHESFFLNLILLKDKAFNLIFEILVSY